MAETNFTITKYKGMQLLTPSPIGRGGDLINDNFRDLADRVTSMEFTISGDGTQSLSTLTDVTLTTLNNNNLLVYNISLGRWINQTAQQAGLAPLDHTHEVVDIIGLDTAVSNNISVLANTEHSNNLDNPHSVTAEQVGAGDSLWNASKIVGRGISSAVPGQGQVLKFNAVTNLWEPSDDLTSGSVLLDDILNVDVSGNPSDNEVLAYDFSTGLWKRQTAAQANLALATHSHAIGNLDNVTLATTGIGPLEILGFDGANQWINKTLSEAGIAALGHTHVASQITDFDGAVGDSPAVVANTTHAAATNNPHGVTAAQVGNSIAQWNADSLRGNTIETGAPVDGDFLVWSTINDQWEATAFTGVSALDDLNDIAFTTPLADDEVLVYDIISSKWINKLLTDIDSNISNIPGNTAHSIRIDNPHNVTATQVGNNTAQWNANQLQGIDISAAVPTSGQVLKFLSGQWIPAFESGEGGSAGIVDSLGDLSDVVINDFPDDYGILTFHPINGWTDLTLLDNEDFTSHTHNLDDLLDVAINETSLADGHIITYDLGSGTWINRAGSTTSILGLSDVPDSFGTTGQILAVNAGQTALEFVDASSVSTIADLTDVAFDDTVLSDGQVLTYDGVNGNWENRDPAGTLIFATQAGLAADNTDQTAALQTIIDAASFGTTIDFEGKIYRLDGQVLLKSGLTLQNGEFDMTNSTGVTDCLYATGTIDASISLTASANANVVNLTLSSTATISAGDWLILRSTTLWADAGSVNVGQGEYVRVKSVDSSTTVTLYARIHDTYTTTASAAVERVTHVTDVHLRDIKAEGSLTENQKFVRFRYARHCSVKRCEVIHFQARGVQFDFSIYGSVEEFYAGRQEDTVAVAAKIGVAIISSTAIRVDKCHFEGCKQGVITGGDDMIVRYCAVTYCTIFGSVDAAIDAHPATQFHHVVGNHIRSTNSGDSTNDGIIYQGTDPVITGNTISGDHRYGIFYEPFYVGGLEFGGTIANNQINGEGDAAAIAVHNNGTARCTGLNITGNSRTGGSGSYKMFLDLYTNVGDLWNTAVTGNSCFSISERVVHLRGNSGTLFRYLTITGNVFSSTVSSLLAGIEASPDASNILEWASVSSNVLRGPSTSIVAINFPSSTDFISVMGNVQHNFDAMSPYVSAGANSLLTNNI